MGFRSLELDENLLQALQSLQFEKPTPIQEQAIPEILAGHDLLASAQTGTGKTAAYLLPVLHKICTTQAKPGHGPRLLVLAPTRELAMQISSDCIKFSNRLRRCKTLCIFGGSPYPEQNRMLARPYEILVATPGRLIDHLKRGRVEFSRLETVVLDEADRLLDLGFIQAVEEITQEMPEDRQTLLFSATLSKNIRNLSQKLQKNPKEITVKTEIEDQSRIEQKLHQVDDLEHKYRLLDHLLQDETLTQAIIFTATKSQTGKLSERLQLQGMQAAALHGDMNQRQRSKTISLMRQGKFKVLVATDVAARGIDIKTVTHVFNFDIPFSEDDYVHRIGRTGRAGASGVAFLFVAPHEMRRVNSLEKTTGQKITPLTIPGMEPKLKASSKPGGFKKRRPPFKGPRRNAYSRRAP